MLIPFLQRFDYGRRASGFYVCPNHLAGALEVLGIFGTSLVCWSRFPTWSKLLIGYASAICYVGILLTASRGGYASTIVSLFVFVVLSLIVLRRAGGRLFWSIGGISVLAALIIGGAAVLFVKKSDFLADRAQNALSTARIRLDLWHAAIEEWKSQPLIGTGSGTYLYYGRMFRTERMQQDPAASWEVFSAANPDLFAWRPSILDRYYQPETLNSDLARRVFASQGYTGRGVD